jgi:predicted dehydrogenase
MDRPVNTALTALGLSGRVFHAPFLMSSPYYKITSVLERSKSLSGTIVPRCRIVRKYEDILNDKNIELVIVNTPDNLHFDMALKALNAGKHVVVEKPFTQTLAEAEELAMKAQKKGLLLTAYHNRRFDGDFITLQKIIKKNILGRIVEFESRMDRYTPHVHSVWREIDTGKNSCLYNMGPHMIDQAIVLFGKPKKITADLKKIRRKSLIYDYCDIKLTYSSRAVTLKCSYLALEPSLRFRINGETGTLIKYGSDSQEYYLKRSAGFLLNNGTIPDESIMLILNKHGKIIKKRQALLEGSYASYYNLLFKAIRKGDNLPVCLDDILLNMEILEKALESHKRERTIYIN